MPHPDCIIVGAGLAGACAARTLALAGQQILLLDAAAGPAQGGASALPVGLMAPIKGGKSHAAEAGQADWDAQGMATTHAWLRELTAQGRLQQGQDWQPCGSAERAPDNAGGWLWQADAAWVKPQRLATACAQEAGVHSRYNTAVQSLHHANGLWQVQLASGEYLQAPCILLAAAWPSQTLLQNLKAAALPQPTALLQRLQHKKILNPTAGQAIYAPWQPEWAEHLPLHKQHSPHACNGHGHFVPAVPMGMGQTEYWLSGATYVHQASANAANSAEGEAANLQRLSELLPQLAPHVQAQQQVGLLQRFNGLRCTTPSRRPIVGELAHGLWLAAGFGSRGLSHAPLAAEHLAQRIVGR